MSTPKILAVKFPDLFYIKQTRVLNNLHDFSVELLDRIYKSENPPHAYDSDWGERQIRNLTASIGLGQDTLSKETSTRLLRQKMAPPGLNYRTDRERDTFRMESIQINIEYELKRLLGKQLLLIGWIASGIILASLACELIQLCFP